MGMRNGPWPWAGREVLVKGENGPLGDLSLVSAQVTEGRCRSPSWPMNPAGIQSSDPKSLGPGRAPWDGTRWRTAMDRRDQKGGLPLTLLPNARAMVV